MICLVNKFQSTRSPFKIMLNVRLHELILIIIYKKMYLPLSDIFDVAVFVIGFIDETCEQSLELLVTSEQIRIWMVLIGTSSGSPLGEYCKNWGELVGGISFFFCLVQNTNDLTQGHQSAS